MIVRDIIKNCYFTSDGKKFDNLVDALIYELGYKDKIDKLELHEFNFFFLYDKYNLGNILALRFHDLITTIYKYPNAKIINEHKKLNETQNEFLEKVRELGKEAKIMDALMR